MDAPIVGEDRQTGTWVVALHGALAFADCGVVRRAVDSCIAQCPAAIVLDLHGLTGLDEVALPVLPSLQRRVDAAGVRLVYAAAEDLIQRVARGPARHFFRIHHTVAQAREWALRQPGHRWLRLRLAPTPLASGIARTRIGDACPAWGVSQVLHQVRLVVSELVDNAAEHARTDIEVTAAVLGDHLHIRVRDGNFLLPARRDAEPRHHEAPLDLRGTGLRLLDRYTAAWGVTRQPDGKTVWATVPVRTAG